jgi:Peptidase family M1 domain
MAISRRLIAAAAALVTLPSVLAVLALSGSSAAAAACTPGQLIGNSGFESGSTPWTSTSGVIGAFSGQSAHAGTRFAWMDGYGQAHTDTLSQPVTLPTDCTTATLQYWLHIDTAEAGSTVFDTLTVKLGPTTIASYSNVNAATGYQQRTVNVAAFAGQTATLTFTAVEDAGAQTSFVVDDVTLNTGGGTTPTPTPTPSPTPTGGGTDPTRTPSGGSYTLNLTSDATGATWTGHETIAFTNASPLPLTEAYLRLWDNFHGTCPSVQPVVISAVTGGTMGALEVGCTAVKITLPAALAQGQSGTIGFNVSIAVPDGSDRFGRDGAYNFIGNAIPVLAVRDAAGWHLSPYTNNGEAFYQLASNYAVSLDHPTSVLTPTTGTATEAAGASGRTVTTATANNVREFAWVAGPFVKTTAVSPGGVRVNTFRTSAVTAGTASSMQSTALSAMDGHGGRFGAYPYGEVDLVLHNNFWFGGMEYPGLVLSQPSATPVIHELGHQWFYGIVGDDEYTTPWLDEGFTDYATDLQSGLTGTNCWNSVTWSSANEKITNSMAYWDANPNRYGTVVYTYGKCALHDLRRAIGDTAMTNLLRSYAASHWYGISTVADFKAAAQAATTVNLTSFWTTHRIDG